jgi:hypothetical protein
VIVRSVIFCGCGGDGSADEPFGVISADVAGVGEQVPAQLVHQHPPHRGVDPPLGERAAAHGIQDRCGNTRLVW